MKNWYGAAWQIGLDIQSDSLRAIAVQRRRYGWQLRHWWRYPLPQQTFHGDQLLNGEQLTPVLMNWRKALPRRFSLRIALPATLILQQTVPLPEMSLSEPALGWYAASKMQALLPFTEQAMALDYRVSPLCPQQLYVTATRAEVLHQWLDCLAQADLTPQVVDIVPAILRSMAQREEIPSHCLLLHRTASYLLWVSPWQQVLRFSTCPLSSAPSYSSLLAEYQQSSGYPVDSCCISASHTVVPEQPGQTFKPFTHLQQIQPPLPADDYTFTLAMGLALRTEEREGS